ncbi:MAG: hypothetical protein K8W52_26765 [Deltaproteobacteria bacterium]|nr:hypothetical protein [Deltaproteobacteria bacterium]
MNATATLARIERMNYAFGALIVVVGAFFGDKAFVGGLMVGVAITCLNFAVMRVLGQGLTKSVASGGSPAKALLLLPKTVALMGVVALALAFLPISPGGFVIGFSVILVSITVEAVLTMLRPTAPAGPPPADPTNPDELHHG